MANVGGSEGGSHADVSVYLNGNYAGRYPIPQDIPPGGVVTVPPPGGDWTVGVTKSGTYNVTVWVDEGNRVPETNEDNNGKTVKWSYDSISEETPASTPTPTK